jgi:hypothetical protein
MAESDKHWSEEFRIAGNRVVDRIKELIREGNVRRIVIRRADGTVIRDIPMTQGVAVGGLLALLAPGLAALGALLAFASEVRVEVIREGARPANRADTEPTGGTASSAEGTEQDTTDHDTQGET